jgi:hypothetical protein
MARFGGTLEPTALNPSAVAPPSKLRRLNVDPAPLQQAQPRKENLRLVGLVMMSPRAAPCPSPIVTPP